jgi:hypothetical protein
MSVARLQSEGRTPDAPSAQIECASILFKDGAIVDHEASEPDFFADLNLDQILDEVTVGREGYELAPFFYQPLHDVADVEYRHCVLRDLERPEVSESVRAFAAQMAEMRKQLEIANKLRDPHQSERWFLSAVALYCAAVRAFAGDLGAMTIDSSGMVALERYLVAYAGSDTFEELARETARLETALAEVRYTVLLRNLRVTVSPYQNEPDLSTIVEETFARFRQGAVKGYLAKFANYLETDPVEERVLSIIAELYPALFGQLAAFLARRRTTYLDPTIARFDREVQFYLAYLEHIAPLKEAGLSFCYPAVSTESKWTRARAAFDLALAYKLVQTQSSVVTNDVSLEGQERIIVITGPNQGGKTTFARMFGQLHHLAALGLPVPGTEVELFLPDRLFAHFEREEDLTTLRGKFEDELVRLHEILGAATSDSVLIMNESFNSTTLHDALWVGERVLGQIVARDMLCLCVTFVDELASLSPTIVSMMSTVDRADPTVRTFRVVRKPADGLAYATALAEKHGVSYGQLKARLAL